MRRRHCIVVFFATSTALFCLQNIYKSGVIQLHVDNLGSDIELAGLGSSRISTGIRTDGSTVHLPRPGQGPLTERSLTNQSSLPLGDKGAGAPHSGKTALSSNGSMNAVKWREAGGNGFQVSSGASTAALQQVRPPSPTPQQPLLLTHSNQYYIPLWQQRLREKLEHAGGGGQLQENGSYFLAELLQVRVYEEDKAEWTIRELKQWMHYMFLAGVQHIYLCDHYKFEYEKLDKPLKRYIDLGLVTYLSWADIRHPMTAQVKCYQKMIDDYKNKHTWQIAVDMDEYPFSSIDTREDFLVRYLKNTTANFPNPMSLTEISMNNYLMLGQGDRTKDIIIERIDRMTPKPANVLVKPIYKPARVRANIHHNILQGGRSMTARDDQLRMLHYWGARTQNWGPDTPETLSITQPMDVMRTEWGPQVRNSLLVFGEDDAFSASTGP